jgi:hypothetical protein
VHGLLGEGAIRIRGDRRLVDLRGSVGSKITQARSVGITVTLNAQAIRRV